MKDDRIKQVLTRQLYIASPNVLEIYRQLLDILRREGKSFNTWVYEQMVDYVVKHGQGNPVFRLDAWLENPDVVAFPTLGEPPTIKKLLRLPTKMLTELKNNAAAYASQADYLLTWIREHENSHAKLGYSHPNCPYCGHENR